MIALLWFFLTLFASPFKSKSRLEAENAALRHQLIVLQRRVSGRVQLTNGDRLFLVMLYRWFWDQVYGVLKCLLFLLHDVLLSLHPTRLYRKLRLAGSHFARAISSRHSAARRSMP